MPADKLDEMFYDQIDVIQRIGLKQLELGRDMLPTHLYGELDNPLVAREITANVGFCIEELVEALREIPARKPWKANPDPANWDSFRKEMGDAFAFLLEACIFAGIGPADLHATFSGVTRKNIERASSNEY